jgi:hypothetical protein
VRTTALAVAICLALPAFAADPIRLHPDNPHYFLFRGKPAILIGSTEHYGAVLNLDFDYKPYLDELQSKGLNLTRTFSGTYREIPGSFNITDNTLGPKHYICPFARTNEPGNWDGGKKFDLRQWDDQYFTRLKDFLTEAGKRGIVVEYVLFCTLYNDELWKANPLNSANNTSGVGNCGRREVFNLQHKEITAVQEAFVHKVAAELKDFDNVYFEICNEPYFENVTLEWQAHIARTIADAEKELPARHLIAQNIANDRQKVEKPDPNVSLLNFHYATPPVTVQENYGLKRAIGDDETGFRGKEDMTYRTEGWDFIIAGGASYDNLDYSFTPPHPSGDFLDYKSPGGGSPELRKQLGMLKRFMDDLDLVHMSPQNGIVKGGQVTTSLVVGAPAHVSPVTVRVLGAPGKVYAIYARGGGIKDLALELPQGTFKAEWLNTRTGKIDKEESFTHAGGARTLAFPPYSDDIALRITAQ